MKKIIIFCQAFVSQNFYSAYKYVLWIALGYAFQGMYFMVVNYIFYGKKTYILAWVTFTSAGINIVLNYFFIKFILVWILSSKAYKMPWNIFTICKKVC